MPIIPAGDLVTLRKEPHRSRLYLVVQQPVRYDTADGFDTPEARADMVWYGRVTVAPISDPVVSLTVASDAACAAATIYDGMTVLFSGPTGGYGYRDRAVAKVHGDQTLVGGGVADTLYVHVSSDLSTIANLDFVTIIDEHRFWTRYPKVEGPTDALVWYKDYGYYATHIGEALANLGYTYTQLGGNAAARREASMPPVPILGPHAVAFIDPTVASVNINFDWSDSYTTAPGGGAITWGGVPGATSTAYWVKAHGAALVSSTAQVPGAVNYTAISGLRGFRVGLNLMVNGGQHPIEEFRRGVRYVFTLRRPGEKQVGDPDDCYPITDFELQDCSGSFDSGGWRARVRVFGTQASEYNIQPGSLCIVFADDWYGSTHESVGPNDHLLTDRENIVMCGYVGDGSIVQDSETGDVSFDMLSLAELMKTRENYPVPIENNDLATTWYQTPDLTIDRAAHHYITWHTNLKQVADVFQTADTREIAAMDFLAGDCYSTVDTFLNDRIFARLLCNRFGQLKMDIDRDMEAANSGATLFTFANGDQIAEFTADEVNETPVSIVDLGGIFWNAGAFTPYLSHAPGVVSRYWGNPDSSMSLAIASQAQLNTLAGRYLAYKNCRFPRITIPMSGNWRTFDIWPQEYIDLSKITWRYNFEGNVIVREVSFEHDATAGAVFTTLTGAQETDGPAGMTVPIEEELPPVPPPPYIPPPAPPGGFSDSGRRILATNMGIFVTDDIGSAYPHWYAANTGLPTAALKCWKIIRDPWHWWTTNGAERTLWGLFSFDYGAGWIISRYIYKHENFPHGTWTLSADAYLLGLPGTTQRYFSDICGTIEREDYIYATAYTRTAGLDTGQGWFVRTLNGGAAWTAISQFNAGALTEVIPSWCAPACHRIDTAKHSAALKIYVADVGPIAINNEGNIYRSSNGGTTWTALTPQRGWTPHGGWMVAGFIVPYHSASWGDSDLWYNLGVNESPAEINTLQHSTDSGASWTGVASFLPSGYHVDSMSEYTNDRLKLAVLVSAGAASNSQVYTTSDGGTTWTLWRTLNLGGSYWASPGCQFGWSNIGTLDSVLLWDGSNLRVILANSLAEVDKTGDLLTVAAGIDEVSTIERDTMGGA